MFLSYRSSKFLQDLQVEFEEEAESQRATKLHFSSGSRRREDQLVQEDVIGPAEGLIIPRPEGNTLWVGFCSLFCPTLKIKMLSALTSWR